MAPSPWPSRPELMTIHGASLDADQTHSRPTVTFSVPAPPADPYVDADAVIEGWHRSDVGAVGLVLVVAEFPHALEMIAVSHTLAGRALPGSLIICAQMQRTSRRIHAPNGGGVPLQCELLEC